MKNFPMDGKFGISMNEDDYVNSLNVKDFNELSKKEIEEARLFLYKFKDKSKMVLKAEKKTKGNILHRFRRKYHRDRIKDKSRLKTFKESFKYMTPHISKFKYSSLWETPKSGEKFFLFPLHFHCESILTYRNPQFWRQEWIVEYVARMLPDGYKLYVKGHPEWNTNFPYSSLKEISKISNVRLIEPNYNSHELIKKSSAVVVISNTTGYEAIIYGKPVVCLGKVYYRDLGFTIDVNNLWKLSERLNEAINYELKKKDIIRFVNAFQNQYDGYLRWDRGPNGELLCLDDKNIKRIVNAIVDFSQNEQNY